MKRSALVAAVIVVTGIAASPAQAAKTTVKGKGDIEKMFVDNARKALKVKLWGFGEPCSTRFFSIDVTWGKTPMYQVQAGCYGTDWQAHLYYVGDPDSRETSTKKVKCGGFKLSYADGVYTATMPRSCLKKAASTVRVKAEGFYRSPIGGTAGPTKKLRRG